MLIKSWFQFGLFYRGTFCNDIIDWNWKRSTADFLVESALWSVPLCQRATSLTTLRSLVPSLCSTKDFDPIAIATASFAILQSTRLFHAKGRPSLQVPYRNFFGHSQKLIANDDLETLRLHALRGSWTPSHLTAVPFLDTPNDAAILGIFIWRSLSLWIINEQTCHWFLEPRDCCNCKGKWVNRGGAWQASSWLSEARVLKKGLKISNAPRLVSGKLSQDQRSGYAWYPTAFNCALQFAMLRRKKWV